MNHKVTQKFKPRTPTPLSQPLSLPEAPKEPVNVQALGKSQAEVEDFAAKKKEKSYYKYESNCGTLAISLTATASPASYANIGDIILLTYVVTNTGTVAINGEILLDSTVAKTLVKASLGPGQSKTILQGFSVDSTQISQPFITVRARAKIHIKKCKFLVSDWISTTITNGSADLQGTLSLNYVDGVITGTVTITNAGTSTASNIRVSIPLPANLTNVVLGNGVSLIDGVLLMGLPSLTTGTTATFTFSATPTVIPSTYTFVGTITSATYNPICNNTFSATINII